MNTETDKEFHPVSPAKTDDTYEANDEFISVDEYDLLDLVDYDMAVTDTNGLI